MANLNGNDTESNRTGKILSTLILLMGANIVAPKELRDKKAAELNVENNEPLANILIEMNNLDEKEKLAVAKAIIVSTLKPVQCINLAMYVRNHINDIVQYVHAHEEVKEKVNPEDLLDMED